MFGRGKKKGYDLKVATELEAELGSAAAHRIAATEMDGARTKRGGGLDADQTYCNNLEYNEALPPSRGRSEGRRATMEALKQDQEAQEWLRQHPELR